VEAPRDGSPATGILRRSAERAGGDRTLNAEIEVGLAAILPADGAESADSSIGESQAFLCELRRSLTAAIRLLDDLEAQVVAAPSPGERRSLAADVAQLRDELAASEADREVLTRRLVATEQQASRLTNLYVITYQLHATLDPEEVQSAIAEIALDMLGAERFALLLRSEDDSACRIVLRRGMEDRPSSRFAGPVYIGGDAFVDRGLADGQLLLGPEPGSEALAVVPLRIQGSVAGALVVFELLPHRVAPLTDDRELLDLVAAHAASALLAAHAYATAKRKVHTLEGLLTLLKRL
jgi:GAF domain-containing protein